MRRCLALLARASLAILLFASVYASASNHSQALEAEFSAVEAAVSSLNLAHDGASGHSKSSESKDHHPKGTSHCVVQCVSGIESQHDVSAVSIAYKDAAYVEGSRTIFGVEPAADDRPPRV